MSAKTARWIFLVGTLVSLVLFLGLTVDTHRQIRSLTHADKLTAQVVAGKRVWHKYNCNDCHTVLGFGSYYAPDMTKAYWRRGAEGIAAVIRDPERHTSWRKMPKLNLTDAETADLAAFLQWTSEIDTQEWPPQDRKLRSAAGRAWALGVSPGATLFQTKGCFECHRMHETGGDQGPDLTHVGSRLTYETIARILADPASVNPQATMPPSDLTDAEAEALGRFLAGLK